MSTKPCVAKQVNDSQELMKSNKLAQSAEKSSAPRQSAERSSAPRQSAERSSAPRQSAEQSNKILSAQEQVNQSNMPNNQNSNKNSRLSGTVPGEISDNKIDLRAASSKNLIGDVIQSSKSADTTELERKNNDNNKNSNQNKNTTNNKNITNSEDTKILQANFEYSSRGPYNESAPFLEGVINRLMDFIAHAHAHAHAHESNQREIEHVTIGKASGKANSKHLAEYIAIRSRWNARYKKWGYDVMVCLYVDQPNGNGCLEKMNVQQDDALCLESHIRRRLEETKQLVIDTSFTNKPGK